MEGESPIPSDRNILLEAVLLSVLGLYETIELMETNSDDLFWIHDHGLRVWIGGITYGMPIHLLREDFDVQFSWLEHQVNEAKITKQINEALDSLTDWTDRR